MGVRNYILSSLARYWPLAPEAVQELPIPDLMERIAGLPASHQTPVPLPEWAADLAPEGRIPVPSGLIAPGERPLWRRTDWLSASFWRLNCQAERDFEARHGPIHSNSARLTGFDPAMWQRCWVNRTALFLRRWAARRADADESRLGPLPPAEIVLTCDVDALDKTLAVRLKQTVFRLMGALSAARSRDTGQALFGLRKAAVFALSNGDYDAFPLMAEATASLQVRKVCNVFAGRNGRPVKERLLMDPAYDLGHPALGRLAAACRQHGWEMGLHQSYGTWNDERAMTEERQALESWWGAPVSACRQHWLRFSFAHTWKAQQAAGLAEDLTLGFNDRPGFRCAAALQFHPWDDAHGGPMRLSALPLALMDGQLFAYTAPRKAARRQVMAALIDEIREVRGQAAILWHPHSLSRDFGWAEDFHHLTRLLQPPRTAS